MLIGCFFRFRLFCCLKLYISLSSVLGTTLAKYSGLVADTSDDDLGELLLTILGKFHKFHLVDVSTHYVEPRQYCTIVRELWLAMAEYTDDDIEFDVHRFRLTYGASWFDGSIDR